MLSLNLFLNFNYQFTCITTFIIKLYRLMISLRIALFIILLSLITANVHLNVKYRDFINGHKQLNTQIVKDIYNNFRSPYHQKSEYRFKLFYSRLQRIVSHNKDQSKSWKKGITPFTDMTFEQFKAKKLMQPQNCSATNRFTLKTKTSPIPPYYQWNSLGVVTPVKDQGDCGSCWTFSTVGAMQSHWNILGKGKNVLFSQQQLVDCAGNFQNYGCDGGLPSQAFEYITYAGGLQTQITYPYAGVDQACRFRKNLAVGYIRFGSYNITQGDQDQLADRLYHSGPISISFEVTDQFMDYVSGVYEENGCGTTTQDVNHAVLATGYGVEGGIPFWNVKNSWSTQWGNKGYFKIIRGKNMCAVAQCNSYPLIDAPQKQLIVQSK